MRRIGDHAVVIGASLGGMLAARVLADSFERVTVVERDALPTAAESRRGVPQGRHAHVLLTRGAQILDELFPGLLNELVARGTQVIQDFEEMRFSPGGHLLRLEGHPSEPITYQASRPFLECHLRARVRSISTIDIADRCNVGGFVTTSARDRVTGVRIRRSSTGVEEELGADLVLDATGRGGRAAAWLEKVGYDPPPEERLSVNLRYATRHLRLRPDALREKFVAIGAEPDRPTGFVLLAEEDRWVLTLIGYEGHHPPTAPEHFLAFVQAIAPPDVLTAICDAELVDDIVAHGFPASLRRRYERMRRFPDGLLVFGDGICSLNPAYALGMSVAAQQALALRDSLLGGDRDLARRFFRAAARPVNGAWQLATGADLSLPQVQGPRPLPFQIINSYIGRILIAAERDPVVAEQFLRVNTLEEPFRRLFRPSIARRAVFAGPGRRRAARSTNSLTRS